MPAWGRTRSRTWCARTSPPRWCRRELIAGIDERIDYKGHVVVPLDEDGAGGRRAGPGGAGVEAIAVSLLWSFRNPVHERASGEIIAEEAPGMYAALVE